MSWSKGHSSLEEKIFQKPTIDRCINCGDHEQVQARITMEFGEGNYNSGPICRKCYSIHRGPRIAEESGIMTGSIVDFDQTVAGWHS